VVLREGWGYCYLALVLRTHFSKGSPDALNVRQGLTLRVLSLKPCLAKCSASSVGFGSPGKLHPLQVSRWENRARGGTHLRGEYTLNA